MSEQAKLIDNIEFEQEQPTTLSFKQLYQWVIWQFPHPMQNGLSGAVRPPEADANWVPAVIFPKQKRVQVYAHLDSSHATPEEAAEYIQRLKIED
jgi:hypothetical protein